MPRKVTVTYASPGLQPPVYITTSLSEPQWELLEMDCTESPSGERTFFKTFQAAEGEYQYKFRLGPGDWWACDEAMPTVDDGFGNRNNVLDVKGDVPARTSAANQPQTNEGSDSELGLLSPGPAFAHERDVAHHKEKRDSLGDDVLGKSPVEGMEQTEHDRDHDHHAPLFAHEQNGSPHPKLVVPPEDVPVNFSRQDTQTLDDDVDGDVEPAHFPGSPLFAHERDVDEEPSHFPESPLFAHERDVKPLRIHTPGADEDEDHMEDPPLMKHETLSPTSSRQDNPFSHNQNHDGYDSDVLVSPVSSHASLQLSLPEDHAPAEADPNDPSLEQFPTHHEGILSSLRRASMRMTEDQTAAEVHATTSPVSKTKSQSSSQSPSLPSVLEDEEEELEEDSSKAPEQHAHTANAKIGVAAGAMAGLTMLSKTHERPAALMTPPRTPDESKAPHGIAPPASDHHHKPAAEKDMLEEATHDVSHHESASEKDQTQAGGPGDNKSPWDGFFQTAMGLGLTILVGAGAAWLAFRMQDSIKDGGAVLKR